MAVSTETGFENRVVVLAGATGRLGVVVARRLLAGGARLALTVRRPWQVERLRSAFGPAVLIGVVASMDSEAAAGFMKGTRDALGPIDVLIVTIGAFAGAEIGKDPTLMAAELVEANYLAPATLIRSIVPQMRRRNVGSIVVVGGSEVELARPGYAHFLASKSALHSFASCLRSELEGSGVRVAVVAPPLPSELEAALPRAADRILAATLAAPPGAPPLYPPDRHG